jgi:NADPH:quinone reductase-like Zn-dependent oxidoreductase/short-subunit dehydrogenase
MGPIHERIEWPVSNLYLAQPGQTSNLKLGPTFRWIHALTLSSDRQVALAQIRPAANLTGLADPQRYSLHPGLIDSGFQAINALLIAASERQITEGNALSVYIPTHIGRIDFVRKSTAASRVLVQIVQGNVPLSAWPQSVEASIWFLCENDEITAQIAQCRLSRIDSTLLLGTAQQPTRLAYILQACPLPGQFKADTLPTPADLLQQADARLALPGVEDKSQRTQHLIEIMPLLDRLAGRYALAAFCELDVFEQPQRLAKHPVLAQRLAAMLMEDGLVYDDGQRLVRNVEMCSELPTLDQLWLEALTSSPSHVAELTLLSHYGQALPGVLTNQPTQNSERSEIQKTLVDHFFESSPTWIHARRLMSACAELALEGWTQTRRMRVLEIESPDSDELHPLEMHLPLARCERVLVGTPTQVAGGALSSQTDWRIQTWTVPTLAAAKHWPPQSANQVSQQPQRIDASANTRASSQKELVPYDLVLVKRALLPQTDRGRILENIYDMLSPGGLIVLSEPTHSRFSEIVFSTSAGTQNAYLSGQELSSLLERAGFKDIVRHAEDNIKLSGAPNFVIARKPLAASRTSATAARIDQGTVLAGSLSRPSREDHHWLILYAADADAQPCTELAQTLGGLIARSGGDAQAVALSAARRRIAALPSGLVCELVFVAPVVSDHAGVFNKAGVHENAVIRVRDGAVKSLVDLVRNLSTQEVAATLRLTIVTRAGAPFAVGEQRISSLMTAAQPTNDMAPTHMEQAAVWGLGRALVHEAPNWGVRLIDVHPGIKSESWDYAGVIASYTPLTLELLSGDTAETLLGRQGRWTPVLLDAAQARRRLAQPPQCPVTLLAPTPGALERLEWTAIPECALEPDQVEIEPYATGLDCRDVMISMGRINPAIESGLALSSIGIEFSGRVIRVGSAVNSFRPGDTVMGCAPAALSTRVYARAAALVHKPACLSFEEAATIPIAFVTATFALIERAHLQRGEVVLIHDATSTTGMAALQIARQVGAHVLATVDSPEKCDFVRMLGAEHVFDSTSLSFINQIRKITNEQGVDIIFNTLTDVGLELGVDLLRPFGRFLEVGKRNVYQNSMIGLRSFRHNVSFFGIDSVQLIEIFPQRVGHILATAVKGLEQRTLYPLVYRAFAASQAKRALSVIEQSHQLGKVLITYPCAAPMPESDLSVGAHPSALDPSGAYLIVGGTGRLGFETAHWMIKRGARHIILISRTGQPSVAQQAEIELWKERLGTQVKTHPCDVTDLHALTALIDVIEAQGTPIKGAVYSLMCYENIPVRQLDDAHLSKALLLRMAGAWNLHCALGNRALECFILYASAAAYLGTPGQGSAVAIGTFFQALVAMRRASGLKAVCMAWGPIGGDPELSAQSKTGKATCDLVLTPAGAMDALSDALNAQLPGEAVLCADPRTLLRQPVAENGHAPQLHQPRDVAPAGRGKVNQKSSKRLVPVRADQVVQATV